MRSGGLAAADVTKIFEEGSVPISQMRGMRPCKRLTRPGTQHESGSPTLQAPRKPAWLAPPPAVTATVAGDEGLCPGPLPSPHHRLGAPVLSMYKADL